MDALPPDSTFSNGLLETMRCHRGRLPLWPLHRARLERCAGVAPGDLAPIEQALASACRELPAARVRLRLGGARGRWAWDISLAALEEQPPLAIRLHPCTTRLPSGETANPGCKFLDRTRYNRAKAELPGSFPQWDGLLRDSAGRVIESLHCNLLLWRDGRWETPDLSRCGVRGVMRRWLGDRVGLVEADISLEVFLTAEEAALCNSVRGVVPVQELAGYRGWECGAHTRRLQQLIADELW